jgi:hypothetical protein
MASDEIDRHQRLFLRRAAGEFTQPGQRRPLFGGFGGKFSRSRPVEETAEQAFTICFATGAERPTN